MKNLKFLFIVLIMSLSMTSCKEKENEFKTENLSNIEFKESQIKSITEIDSYLASYHTNKNWFDKIKKWIKAHTGSHLFDNCTGSYGCGPCVGICLGGNAEYATEDYELTPDEIAEGINILEMTLVNDGTGKIIVSFGADENVIFNDNVYIPEDIDLGEEVAEAFERESFILEKGLYPVSYQYNENGETVLELKE